MTDSDLHNLPADVLMNAFALVDKPNPQWTSREYDQILSDQLDAPLMAEIAEGISGYVALSQSAEFLLDGPDPKIETLRELLKDPNPSRQLLTLAKDFAKLLSNHPGYPQELGMVIYYAVIAVAHEHKLDISSLASTSLDKGMTWAMEQPWLDAEIAQLFKRALST